MPIGRPSFFLKICSPWTIIVRYVSHFRADRSRGSRLFRKRPGHNFSPSERVFSLEYEESHIADCCPRKKDIGEDGRCWAGWAGWAGLLVSWLVANQGVGAKESRGSGAEGPEPRNRAPEGLEPRTRRQHAPRCAQARPSLMTRPRAEGSSCDRKARPSRMPQAPCPP